MRSLSLFLLSLAESLFLPIPPDPLLIILLLAKGGDFLSLVLLATLGSLLGASIAYFLGSKGGRPLVLRLGAKEGALLKTESWLRRYDVAGVFLAGVTPIPYKLCAFTAGVFRLHYLKFLLASFFARGLRFYSVCFFTLRYGEGTLAILKNHLAYATGILLLGLALFFLLRFLFKRSAYFFLRAKK